MASWKRFFSGVTLHKTLTVELPPQWWDKPERKPSQQKTPHLREPIRVLEGTVHQGKVGGPFAGNQCTSICLDAICWWMNVAKCGDFTEVALDHVTYSGHYLHLHLRLDLKVSDLTDMRVSIEDLPDSCVVESGMYYNKRTWQEYCSLTRNQSEGGSGDLKSFRDYLLSCIRTPFGVLVTIGDFTQAVMYNTDKKWLVFDSHGGIRFLEREVKFSSCWVFDTMDAMIVFILTIRKSNGSCLVAKPIVLNANKIARCKSKADLHALEFNNAKAAPSASCPGKIESSPFELEEDPYVSFMGGFGC